MSRSRSARSLLAFLFTFLGSLGGCAADGPAVAQESGPRPELCSEGYDLTWESWGTPFFATYCNSCHSASSPNRYGAPAATTFDSEAEVEAQKSRITALVIESDAMPLGGGVNEEDRFLLEVFLSCSL